jgi:hypothetical protein
MEKVFSSSVLKELIFVLVLKNVLARDFYKESESNEISGKIFPYFTLFLINFRNFKLEIDIVDLHHTEILHGEAIQGSSEWMTQETRVCLCRSRRRL